MKQGRQKKITQADRDRTYQVLMAALLEYDDLTDEELAQRSRDIWESCYGEDK